MRFFFNDTATPECYPYVHPLSLHDALPFSRRLPAGDAMAVRRVAVELIIGGRPSEPAALTDVEPAVWRGVGPYGQGGTGMTGGVPYGRPLPGWAEDRDGLKLDQLQLRLGPAYPGLPPGLVLEIGRAHV